MKALSTFSWCFLITDIVREKLHNSSRTQKGEVWEEVTLDLLADLQDKQDLETEAVEAALLSVQVRQSVSRAQGKEARLS